jgi:hypothetical protein
MMYAANDMQIMEKQEKTKTTCRLKQKAKASRKKRQHFKALRFLKI